MIRNKCNPLIVPADVVPSDPRFKVDGVFNCGVAKYNDEILLLCRVAESVADTDPNLVKVPVVRSVDGETKIEIITYDKATQTEFDYSDSRQIRQKDGRRMVVALTSLSHLRLARSVDGVHFTLDEKPAVMPMPGMESWGMEDPRITQIGEDYYINYSAVMEEGISVGLLHTKNFENYERIGTIFAPENKDVTIFPEKIGGMYYAFNRPVPGGIGNPNMWLAKSPDLLHWGDQKLFQAVSKDGAWDSGRVGGGAVPIRTEKGWLKIYHAADAADRYCLGVYLLDINDPSKVIAKLEKPLLEPEEDYELHGFFGNVVFTCGALLEGENVIVYYGAADDKICRADIALSELFEALGV